MDITTTETTQETPQQDTKEKRILESYRQMTNIAAEDGGADLADTTLFTIGETVINGIARDETSRSDWLDRYESAIKNAMQEKSAKDYPFYNASNVKYPLIAHASQQFHARAYGAVVKGRDIVKGKVLVDDPANQVQSVADQVANHMSNQLLEEMPGWVDGLDKTLGMLPIVGCVFKKTYRSQIKRMNVSQYITAKDVIIKYDALSVEEAPRVTHPQTYTKNEVLGFIRSGMWREDAKDIFAHDKDNDDCDYDYYECHTWYDLDGDDYEEPYIITVEKATGKVVRIVARYDINGIEANDKGEIIRIKAVDYFTRYIFLTSPDGGVYGMGFGTLLGAINDVVDTLINQLIDAGTLANTGGGFMSKRLKLGKKRESSRPIAQNEWQIVDFGTQRIQDAIFPFPHKEPSQVLFALLGTMTAAGKELSSVTELMTGESRGANESPTTIMALIEQGTMVFTAIYKRIYQSLKDEFKKLYRLNRIYLAQEQGKEQLAEAYRATQFNIIPIADPQDATNTQKIAKANLLMQLKGQGLNDAVITRRYLEALGIDDIQEVMTVPPQPPPPPDPLVIIEQGKFNVAMDKNRIERSKFEWQMVTDRAKMLETASKTILNLANAEAAELGPQLEQYKQQYDSLMSEMETMYGNYQSGMGSVPAQPAEIGGEEGNQGGIGQPAGEIL